MADDSKSKSKLAQALQDAAMKNINEDLNDIFHTMNDIKKSLPELVQEQTQSLHDEISSLEKALGVVPDEFHNSFEKKINRILDVAAEIEDHTKKYQKALVVDLERELNSSVGKINSQLSRQINDNFIIKDSVFYLAMFISALLGGIVAGSMLVGFFYFLT